MKVEFATQFQEVTHEALPEALRVPLACGLTPMVWGERGIGKTQLIENFAFQNNYEVIYLLLSGEDSFSFGGIPVSTQDGIQFTNLIRALCEDKARQGKRAIIFLDDFPAGAANCGSALFSFLQSHYLGNYRLPEGWGVICAGNPPNIKDVAYEIPRPSMSRLVHYLLKPPTIDEWEVWAVRMGILPEITAFLKFYPRMLRFEGIGTHEVTPRSWENASKMASLVAPEQRWFYVGAATTSSVGRQFKTFHSSHVLDINKILNEQKIPELDAIEKQHHFVTSLATLFPSRYDQIASLLQKMAKTHGELFVTTMVLTIKAHAAEVAEKAAQNANVARVVTIYREMTGWRGE